MNNVRWSFLNAHGSPCVPLGGWELVTFQLFLSLRETKAGPSDFWSLRGSNDEIQNHRAEDRQQGDRDKVRPLHALSYSRLVLTGMCPMAASVDGLL